MAETLENINWGEFQANKEFRATHIFNGRFIPYTFRNLLYILDLFYMKATKLHIDKNSPWTLVDGQILLTDETTAISVCVSYRKGHKQCNLIVLKLDYKNSKAFELKTIPIHDLQGEYDPTCDHRDLLTYSQSDGIIQYIWSSNVDTRIHVHVVDLNSEKSVQSRVFELPEKFYFCGIVDGYVYGFVVSESGEVGLDLDRICLETKKRTAVNAELCSIEYNGSKGKFHPRRRMIGRTIITSRYYDQQSMCLAFPFQFFILNLDLLKWRKIDIPFNGTFRCLITDFNRIILQMQQRNEDNSITKGFYRFVINRPDSLINLSFFAIRKKAEEYELPSKLQCPFTSFRPAMAILYGEI
ncbi:hypothetical protein M3Y95_01069100 [Aphelenchoides besseyi]|nr:hypothetical protein M3Y95_01069100 [Aphelenchoides besseyi]